MILKMYIGLHVGTRYSSSILKKLEFFRPFFEKYSNIKFHKNLPIGDALFHVDRSTDGQR
jgi:hypothetical protein